MKPVDERLKQIAEHYGLESQIDILQEECAELIQAVSKYRRSGFDEDVPFCIIEEIADVEIMLSQIKYLLGFSGSISEVKEEKIKRQLRRIDNETV